MSFKDKVVIVTGAGQGIGFEICREFVENGAHVLLNDIDSTLSKKAMTELNKMGHAKVHALPGDCGNTDFIRSMVDYAVDHFGRLDVAVANAGITLYGHFQSYQISDFNKVIRLNLGGSFFLAQAAAGKMKQQEGGGSIAFMSSVTGHLAHQGLAVYGMTKAALEALARNLVIELGPYGINVNTVAPGATLTERTALEGNYEETWNKITPGGRVGRVTDVANAILFLTDEKSRHITGQNIVVDGGWISVGIQPE